MICFRDQSYCAESAGCANTECNSKWTDELAYQANRSQSRNRQRERRTVMDIKEIAEQVSKRIYVEDGLLLSKFISEKFAEALVESYKAELLNEAADAIESLLAENDRLKHNLTSTEQTMREYQELAAKRLEEIAKYRDAEMGGDFDSEQVGYWCVVCGRFLRADEFGVIVHDDKPHPESTTFEEPMQ